MLPRRSNCTRMARSQPLRQFSPPEGAGFLIFKIAHEIKHLLNRIKDNLRPLNDCLFKSSTHRVSMTTI
jgi:hypothetical protein